jgi:hypothetical protein
MVDMNYKIGDYIQYNYEYYSCGGYSYCTKYGGVVSFNKDSCNIIKQYGGQIWHGINPQSKIDEEKFLSKFNIYDEYMNCLIKIKDTLPGKIKNIIEYKCEKNMMKTKRFVLNYTLKNYLSKNKHHKDLKISSESWAIQWYIYNVLRSYEPYKIKDTLSYCYGATKKLQKFMEENIDFLINMQFLRDVYSSIMIYLIEEKILEFNYKEGIFTEEEYFNKILPKLFIIRQIKLQSYLKFKTNIPNININLEINYNKTKYNLVIPSDDLIDTKIIFSSKYGTSKGTNSKCTKKKEFNDLLKYKNIFSTQNVISYTYDKKKKELLNLTNNKKIKINHDSTNSIFYFSKCSKLLVFEDRYSGNVSSKSVFTLFNLEGEMIGFFELYYNDFDYVSAKVI